MHKTKIILAFAIITTIIGVLGYQNHKLTKVLEKQINSLQVPRFIISDEPEKIKNTLTTAHPYLKVWGPDVLYYWSGVIYDQSEKRRIDWRIIAAKIFCESGFTPGAMSNQDAIGISQVLESTAKPISKKLGMTYTTGVTLRNDLSCMIIGIDYLDTNIKREKSIKNGLKSYYAGPGWRKNVNKKDEINDYARNVINEARFLRGVYERLYPGQESFLLGFGD
jgi:hypothetical protein